MRCACCDKVMSPEEIQYIIQVKEFDYCTTCLDVAFDAAYSGDFKRNEETEFEELEPTGGLDEEQQPEFKFDGEVETLDMDTYQSTLEGGDAYDIPWEENDYE